jgi:beta-galactosidase
MSLVYGVDYYPEHWPEDRWAVDAQLMRDAGFQVVRMAEFSWSRVESEPGRFDWGWLEGAIDCLHQYGIKAVLGTPPATPPLWLVRRHPNIRGMALDGTT